MARPGAFDVRSSRLNCERATQPAHGKITRVAKALPPVAKDVSMGVSVAKKKAAAAACASSVCYAPVWRSVLAGSI